MSPTSAGRCRCRPPAAASAACFERAERRVDHDRCRRRRARRCRSSSSRGCRRSTPCASAEISVACGAGSGFAATTPTFGGAGKAVGLRQQVQHRRNHHRARATPTMSAICCRHRRRADELPGLQILQVVIRDRGAGEDDRRDEQRKRHQRRPRLGVGVHDEDQERGARDDRRGCRRRRSGCSTRR